LNIRIWLSFCFAINVVFIVWHYGSFIFTFYFFFFLFLLNIFTFFTFIYGSLLLFACISIDNIKDHWICITLTLVRWLRWITSNWTNCLRNDVETRTDLAVRNRLDVICQFYKRLSTSSNRWCANATCNRIILNCCRRQAVMFLADLTWKRCPHRTTRDGNMRRRTRMYMDAESHRWRRVHPNSTVVPLSAFALRLPQCIRCSDPSPLVDIASCRRQTQHELLARCSTEFPRRRGRAPAVNTPPLTSCVPALTNHLWRPHFLGCLNRKLNSADFQRKVFSFFFPNER